METMQPSSPKTRIILPPTPSAPSLLCANTAEKKLYWDRSHYDSPESQMRALAKSSTLYIGNLAFSTRVSHLKALFSTLGPVASVHMGLDRFRKTPCGFAFVEYVRREDALSAVAYLSGTKLDGRVIRAELDAGFKLGRQFGRGTSGGQVRDDRRATVDPARAKAAKDSRSFVGGGMSSRSRWQAPQRNQNTGGGGGVGDYGPSGESTSSNVGEKRMREDDGDKDIYDYGELSTKNSRFRGEGSDEDM